MQREGGEPPSRAWEGRLTHVDLVRAVAILLVTVYHVFQFYGGWTLAAAGFDFAAIFARGRVGVELFIVISGYCMALSLRSAQASGPFSYTQYLKRRLWRIAPPYYTAILVWCILENRVDLGAIRARTSSFDVVMHVLFMHNLHPSTLYSVSGVFWVLAVEMQLYVLMPLLMAVYRRLPWGALIGAVLLSWWINAGVAPRMPNPNLWKYSALSYLVLFVLGFVLYDRRQALARVLRRPLVVVLYGLILFHGFFNPWVSAHLQRGKLLDFLLGALLGLLLIVLDQPRVARSRWLPESLGAIGRASYSIYLYNHMIHITTRPIVPLEVGFWYYTAIPIVFGGLMYLTLEKPLLRWRRRWCEHKPDERQR